MKFDFYLLRAINMAMAWLAMYCLVWAGALLAMQVTGWLRYSEWQALPLFSLFLNEHSQATLRVFEARLHPLDAVPSWGSAMSLEDLSQRLAGRMLGVQRIFTWLLDTALAFWLVVSAVVLMAASALAREESTALLPADEAR